MCDGSVLSNMDDMVMDTCACLEICGPCMIGPNSVHLHHLVDDLYTTGTYQTWWSIQPQVHRLSNYPYGHDLGAGDIGTVMNRAHVGKRQTQGMGAFSASVCTLQAEQTAQRHGHLCRPAMTAIL